MRRLSFWLVEHVGRLALLLYFATMRFRENRRSELARRHHKGHENVMAFWHAHQLATLVFYRNCGAHILISRSRDGEYAARLAQAMGFRPVRGSTSRGGAQGARALLDAARLTGRAVAITPDGPRGPRHSVQRGVLFIARLSGRPIVPVAVGFDRYWELPSWDRFRIPKPFARAYALLGKPIAVPEGCSDDDLRAFGDKVRLALESLEEEADRLARGSPRR